MVVIVTKAVGVRDFRSEPARLERIHFDGVSRTRYSGLVRETAELFNVRNLNELIVKAYQAKNHLEHVGLFGEVGVVVDVDQKQKENRAGYEVIFVVKEPSKCKGSVSVGVDNRGEAETTGAAECGSVLGKGEQFNGSYTQGHRRTSLFNLAFSKPFLGWQRYAGLNLALTRSYFEAAWSKYSLSDVGGTAELYYQILGNLKHRIRWEGDCRKLGCLSKDTAFEVREHSGYSLKSSLKNVLSYSTLDSKLLPQKGILWQLSQELAGLGGDVRFLRHDFEWTSSSQLFLGLILSASVQASYIHQRSGRTIHLADRVYLGGFNNLRGFGFNAVGPAADECSLGGSSKWCAAVHLYRPLIPKRLLFAHVFAVAGNIHEVSHGASFSEAVRKLAEEPRASAGCGVVVKLMEGARLEFNFCVPLRYRSTDRIEPGFQFGAGISFL